MKKRYIIVGIIALGITFFWNYFRLSGNVLDHIGLAGYSGLSQFEGVELPHSWHEFGLALETFGGNSIAYREDYLREGERISFFFSSEQEKRTVMLTEGILLKLGENVHINASIPLTSTTKISIKIEYDYANRTIIYGPVAIGERAEEETIVYEMYEDEENVRRLLEKYSLTEEDVREFQEYVLYDVVLKSWIGGYGRNFDREKRELQRCKVEDLSFEYEKIVLE